jgi:alpha-glucosidase
VQDALLDTVKFWLELGVDGYRLDAINFCFHDAALRDNPGRGMPLVEDPSAASSNPYSWQHHRYDKSQFHNRRCPTPKRARFRPCAVPNERVGRA